jgi:hypothetical protein
MHFKYILNHDSLGVETMLRFFIIGTAAALAGFPNPTQARIPRAAAKPA